MGFKNKLYNPIQMYLWMRIDFLSLRAKRPCLYVLSNGPMFIKKRNTLCNAKDNDEMIKDIK
jgi:hypothetical protein